MKKLTDITVILDRSGSMEYIKESTIKGFNSFLKEQQNSEGKAKLTLVQFDHEYQVVYEDVDIKNVKKLNNETFVPRGSTALLDAIGVTINNTKNRIKLLSKSKRPDNILVIIITDGEENSSNKYTREKIFSKISKRENKDNWKFIFLGSNQDAIAVGQEFGINANQSLTFNNSDEGTERAFMSVSNIVHHSRAFGNVNFSFSNEDREAQEELNN
jgi:uncharacterized protein YegL